MTHVLAVRLDNAGDVLLAGPAIRALAAGADRVTLLAGPRGHAAAVLLPGVAEIVTWRAPWIDPDPPPFAAAAVQDAVDRVAGLHADRALIFGSFHQSPLPTALVLRQAGVPWIGATSDDYPGALLDLRHRISGDVHEVERSLDLARAAGYALPPGDRGALAVRHFLPTPIDGDYVVVHPGASVPARAWAPGRNAALVDALVSEGRRVVVTGAPSERGLTAIVTGAPRPEVVDLGGMTDLAGLAGVIAGASAIVVGNTGAAHLAAAVGTPVVSLFASTVPPARWRPWRVRHELLHADVPCAGCRARECPVPGQPCLGAMAVQDVVAAVDRLAALEVAA
ncbi:MAG TPA: glycosyltransferase family 9 protein [Solirubrobacteraceae bacterium]|jgi:ADP-heptose:LPS heptosyltransferase|nr:glycosyltransferase family 9 protein [Solirubrobacteraceae bacterium]